MAPQRGLLAQLAYISTRALVSVLTALQLGCDSHRATSSPPPAAVVAVVAGQGIPLATLDERVERWRRSRADAGRDPTATELRRHRVALARQIVNEHLVMAAAAASKPPLQPPADDVLLADFSAAAGTGFTVLAYEERTGESRAELLQRLRAQHVLAQLCGPAPTPTGDEVRTWLESHRYQYDKPRAFRLQRLLWSAPASVPASVREQTRRLAAEASKPERFDAIVTRRVALPAPSILLGWFVARDLPPEVLRYAEAGALQQLSPVLATNNGFEIVRVEARRPPVKQSLEQAEPSIRLTLAQRWRSRRESEVLTELRRRFTVEEPVWRQGVAAEERAAARRKRADLTLRAGGIPDPLRPAQAPSHLEAIPSGPAPSNPANRGRRGAP